MNAEFFVLAFSAALNPKLLALDLLLIENRRPRAMFLCVLLGGMTVALTIGLLDVLTLHADAIKSQGKASASVDLALGLLLLTAGGLLATGRLHRRKRSPVPAGTEPPEQPEKKEGWAARVLAEPRLVLIIIPFAFLELRPEATKALLRRSQDWLLGHAFQLMAGIALALGAYLTVSGLVRLS